MSRPAAILLAAALALGSAAAQPPTRVIGEATTLPSAQGQFSLRDAAGAIWGVQILDDASVVLVAPGAKDLSAATPVPVASIRPGDRLLIRGTLDAQLRTALAHSIVVMSKDAVEAAHARDQAEWRARSLAAVIVSVDPAARTLLLRDHAAPPREWKAAVPESASILRYADDSIRFADARPASLASLHPGDQVRVLGERDETAAAITASRLLAGSFRTLGGEITRIDAASGIVTLRDVQTRQPVQLKINGGANLRRMPAAGAANARPSMGMGMGMMRPNGAGAPAAPRRPDLQQMLDRLPQAAISDLKPGDAVIVSAGRTSGPQPWSVVSLVAGVDALLRAPAAQVTQTLGNWSMDLPMQ